MHALAGLLFTTLLVAAAPQGTPPPAAGSTPHIEWQRSLADALAVQKATGLPLLIAVNMDGEVFNDRFASTTYVDPTFVAATRGYVCVVASPDRHTERDYDALGNRVECPRFPGCTCSEHINIEPELFTRYFHGNRNAPRHVGVSPDGKILFDRFLDASMQTAIDAVEQHRGTPKAADLAVPTDAEQLFARHDAASRRALEQLYRRGDDTQRALLLRLARTSEQFDLLRMGLRDDNQTVFDNAAMALAGTATKDSVIDLEDALARVEDAKVTAALLARLQELGRTDPTAAKLSSHFAADPTARLAEPWGNEWAAASFDIAARDSIEAVLDRCETKLREGPDEATRLRMAIAQAGLATLLAAANGKNVELWFEDAQNSAAKCQRDDLQAEAQAVRAVAAWKRGESEAAQQAAVLALSTAHSERHPDAWLAGTFLGVLVQATTATAYAKANADANASLHAEVERVRLALHLLRERKAGDETASLVGIGLLEFAGLRAEARRELEALVSLMPASPAVHERWRNRMLIDLGAEAMRQRYAAHAAAAAGTPAERATSDWFVGFANLVAGEQHTRDERRDVALAAYDEAIARFAKSAAGNADFADSANHFAVLSLAGRAVLEQAAGDGARAVADLLRAAELRPASLDEADGLQRKPRAIAGRITRELTQQGKTELAEQLKPILP